MKRVRWVVLFALVLGVLALPATAFAARASQCGYPGTNCPPATVLGTNETAPTTATTAAPATSVLPAAVSAGQSSLPFTGGDIAGLGAIGAGAIVVGFLLARTRRSARSRS